MTAFDPETLRELVDEAGASPFLVELVTTYRRMLQARVDRVVGFVDAGDVERGMDAVLSLKVSSTMTGAVELARISTTLEDHLRATELTAARGQARLLPAAVQRAEDAIDAFLALPAFSA